MNKRLSKICVCKHNKSKHYRYQYSGKDISIWDKEDINEKGTRVTIYGPCEKCKVGKCDEYTPKIQ